MYLEQEVYSLLLFAFVAIIVASALALSLCYFRSHNKHIFWFGGQLLFLAVAFYYFYRCVTYMPSHGNSIYSEEQSLTLALSGVSWTVSMALSLMGVYKLSRKSNGDK